MRDRIRWGILGAGNIAKALAAGVAASRTGRLTAVASRSPAKAAAFIAANLASHPQPSAIAAHGSYEALLDDANVDAVYIATPHPLHPWWAVRAAQAGKHILCEKPAALSHGQAQVMIQAAREHRVLFMEAFMYRCAPQTRKLIELVQSGVIGKLRMIEASFGFHFRGDDPNHRLISNALGGGGILDVGCYPVSAARLFAGAAVGQPFVDPVRVQACGQLGPTGVDEYAAAVLQLPGAVIAHVAAGVRVQLDNHLRLMGSEGMIDVSQPWVPAREGGRTTITVKGETVEIEADRHLYAYEVDAAGDAILAGKTEAAAPAMTLDDTLGNMAALDAWRDQIGLVYDAERGENAGPLTVAGLPLRRRASSNMRYGQVPGLNKPVSKLVMGCDNQNSYRDAAPVWDDWIERGGNAFDTACVYGRPRQRIMGQWLKARGLADQVVLICKGAHTPWCDPVSLTSQLRESLDDFQLSGVDLYIMHRDNPQVPVGEFVDVLNEHRAAGRIRAFGGSNWSSARIQAANDYAAQHGKQGFQLLSNNFSLARMVKPVWAGCVAASDAQFRGWLTQTQIANFAWSSQARGYFLPEAQRLKLGQANFECWDAEDNRQRRARAEQLAAQLGVLPINIAAAYVLCQPFPSFALVGPRTIAETVSTLPALDITLTADQLRWLNLES
jgi:predicted dehydrogenase/aryl-alcohol dehydrogenase-like predicted oxidoreductase